MDYVIRYRDYEIVRIIRDMESKFEYENSVQKVKVHAENEIDYLMVEKRRVRDHLLSFWQLN